MRGIKRFVYSAIGIGLFVVLPAFLMISYHMEKGLSGNDYRVTAVKGAAYLQYQVSRSIAAASNVPEFRKTSNWIPLRKGMKIASGARIKLDAFARVDIMRNNDAAIRIKENSSVKLELNHGAEKCFDAILDDGRLLCRVNGDISNKNSAGAEIFRVVTPAASVHVRGTSFSVGYSKDKKAISVGVLKGRVSVEAQQIPDMDFTVAQGKQLSIRTAQEIPLLENLSPHLLKELQAVQDLQINLSMSDRWEDIQSLMASSPLFHKAIAEITKYEMKVFLRAIQYFARLKWNNTLPDTLKAVELEDGDYKDPWGTDYFYEKLGTTHAILISAGPDKILHTVDDIYFNLNL